MLTDPSAGENNDSAAGVEQVNDVIERVDMAQSRPSRRLTQHAHYNLETHSLLSKIPQF